MVLAYHKAKEKAKKANGNITESNIGLEGMLPMRVKMKAGCGMTEILRAGYWRKYFGGSGICSFRQARCGVVLKLTAGCGMKKRKSLVTDVTRGTAIQPGGIGINILSRAGWRESAKNSGGMRN